MHMLKDRGEPIVAVDMKNEARRIKEKYAYVCEDLVEEFKKYDVPVKTASGWALNTEFHKTHIYKPSHAGK